MIERQAPAIMDDRVGARLGSKRFLSALSVILDKRRDPFGAAGDGQGLTMHAVRSFNLRVFQYRRADVDCLRERTASFRLAVHWGQPR